MDFDRVRVAEERALLEHLSEIFNAEVVGSFLARHQEQHKDKRLTFSLRENLLPITESFAPSLHVAAHECITALGYSGKAIEFFISNAKEINAASIYTADHVATHHIILNAGLIDALTEAELRFVIGHEIGHLIYKHSFLRSIVSLVYPEFEQMPPYPAIRFVEWSKLCEMSADRIGLLAAGEFRIAASAMLKISSGLGLDHFGDSIDSYLVLVEDILELLKEDSSASTQTHPGNPLRIKALHDFDRSALRAAIGSGDRGDASGLPDDQELQERVSQLTQLMKRTPGSAEEQASTDFLAAAGFTLLSSDKEISESELSYLGNTLAAHFHAPRELLQSLVESGKLPEVLQKSSEFIATSAPHLRHSLMQRLFPVTTRDGRFRAEEAEAFMKIGTELLHLPERDLVAMVLVGLRQTFSPAS